MKDNRTIHDPLNIFSDGDYNIHKHERISEDIWNYHIKTKRCLTCKLQEEPIIPACLMDCKFRIHWCGTGGKRNSHPVVETRQLHNDSPFRIYMTRAQLVLNFHLKFPFIFRCTSLNGLAIHHRNLNSFDDRPENLVFLISNGIDGHNSKHAHVRSIKEKFIILYDKFISQKRINDMDKELLENYIEEMNSIFDINQPPRVVEFINGVKKAITENKIYLPPREWNVHTGRTKNTIKTIDEIYNIGVDK